MNSTVDYKRLLTMKDLKAERARVHRDLHLTEINLREDKKLLEEMCTVDYWMDMIGTKIPHTGLLYSGYCIIRSMIQRRRHNNCKHREERPKMKCRCRVIYE